MQIELLERRWHLTGGAARVSATGTLLVSGDAQPNVLIVRVSSQNVIASIDGNDFSFPRSIVKRVAMNGFGGADLLDNETSLRCTLRGGDSDDRLIGGLGLDTLEGDDGADAADYSARAEGLTFTFAHLDESDNLIDGEAGSTGSEDVIRSDVEAIIGTPYNDRFDILRIPLFTQIALGEAGDDTFDMGNGSDATAYGGAGNDSFEVSEDGGASLCYGGAGNDTFRPLRQVAIDVFSGGRGRDSINVGLYEASSALDLRDFPDVENVAHIGDNVCVNVTGNDLDNRLDASSSFRMVTLKGLSGNDSLFGSNKSDSLDGGGGNDSIDGSGGNDTINGSVGNDTLIGGPGRDRIYGSDGDDVIFARDGFVDRLYGGGGSDSAKIDGDFLNSVESILA